MELPEQFSRGYIEQHRCILLELDGRKALVGLCNPDDISLKDDLQSALLCLHGNLEHVGFCRVEYPELLALVGAGEAGNGGPGADAKDAKSYEDAPASGNFGAGGTMDLGALVDSGPVVALVNTVLLEALNRRASDIHLTVSRAETRIRFRENGALVVFRTLPRSRFEPIVQRIKHLAGLNILERRQPQDGRLTISVDNHQIDARISTVPTVHGESVVLRLLNQRTVPLEFQGLGFVASQIAAVGNLLRHRHGLLLVTGPTGSGKTTTLHTVLQMLKQDRTRQIMAIEDPVEIESEGIEQIQVNYSIGLTFPAILRRVLRQDPDVLMVGEIRDSETAELAVRAALTGHLVLSTVHTNAALPAVDRLRDMGVQSYLLAATLRGIISQQLVPVLCGCGGAIGLACPTCRGTGVCGRQVVAELLEVGPILAAGIREGRAGAELEVLAGRGYQSFTDHTRQIPVDLRARLVLPRELGLT